MPTISCIIPSRDRSAPKLNRLINSIRDQNYDTSNVEILVITEGDSESAKAIGVRQAKGDILCMLCDDNEFVNPEIFNIVNELFKSYPGTVGIYSKHYHYRKDDNSLNRYFALMGVNDPVPYYLKKADRLSWSQYDDHELYSVINFYDEVPSLGDNGFFIRASFFKNTNLDHYYPMDNCEDMRKAGEHTYIRLNDDYLWHRTTDGNLINFLTRRYRYAKELYCDRSDRRWKIISGAQDFWRLLLFIGSTVCVVPLLLTSALGCYKKRDYAWFWHIPVSIGFLACYTALTCRNLLVSLLRRFKGKNLKSA